MYARRSFDKQWQSMEQKQCNELRRFAGALRGGASQRLRDAMSGIDKQRKGSAEHSEGIA
jgi:hypothetical protein